MRFKKSVGAAAVRAAALIFAVIFAAGCSEIDYSGYSDSSGYSSGGQSDSSESSEPAPPAVIVTENTAKEYKINSADFEQVTEAETLADSELLTDIEKYGGDGYIELGAYGSIELTVDAVSSQFYDITVYACGAGGAVTLTAGGSRLVDSENGVYKRIDGDVYGAYYIPQSDVFAEYSVCPVYLEQGENKLTFQTVSGEVFIDKIKITDGKAVDDSRYTDAQKWISGKDINDGRQALMDYFKSIYGKKTLTAQYCTPNTNAEIDVIYRNTGRYPAIRCSDLMYYTEAGSKLAPQENNDIQLSAEWAKQGGIVSYSWYWYSPIGKTTFYAEECELDTEEIKSDVRDLAVLTDEELLLLLENESITEECYAILHDMDSIASQLLQLKDEGVTVLLRPLPCTQAKWYWWESDADTYKWLWQTMHRRFDELHGLSNIIWVCSVTDEQLFPGEDYIDIIGCDVYNNSNVSNLSAMLGTDKLLLSRRMLALTECMFSPDPDIMYRDNAMWLWTAPWSGKYLINENGEQNGDYVTVNQLKKIYNHELTVTRDELAIE